MLMWILVFSRLKQIKKKLLGLTREHEALFNFVENNRQMCTEKEKQKVQYTATKLYRYLFKAAEKSAECLSCSWLQMLNRLTKSAEMQARVDEEYFNVNMEGHQMRLKWENTLKNCYQVRKPMRSWFSPCRLVVVLRIHRAVLWVDRWVQSLAQWHLTCNKSWTSELSVEEVRQFTTQVRCLPQSIRGSLQLIPCCLLWGAHILAGGKLVIFVVSEQSVQSSWLPSSFHKASRCYFCCFRSRRSWRNSELKFFATFWVYTSSTCPA